jgi:hypothetical protein
LPELYANGVTNPGIYRAVVWLDHPLEWRADMSQLTLKQLVGVALLDREFCDGLMNGKRAELLTGLDLTEEEREVVTSLEFGSIREFAGSLGKWINDPEIPISLQMDYRAVGTR